MEIDLQESWPWPRAQGLIWESPLGSGHHHEEENGLQTGKSCSATAGVKPALTSRNSFTSSQILHMPSTICLHSNCTCVCTINTKWQHVICLFSIDGKENKKKEEEEPGHTCKTTQRLVQEGKFKSNFLKLFCL